ncbi:hypothetical protein O6H91_05G031800 [Diphasiastrum complanatum]|uniref:Uncharacterized protein n=1 Tax=Diphasiastrum complanatum TaxID=34168 RepID=A0ACC2DM35_DIPCM|nr:hypothetical protein O6H91_05G031800 [Diphasiastrum complanatum]
MVAPSDLLYEIWGVKVYSDGTVDRTEAEQLLPTVSANAELATAGSFSKDVVIDSSTGTWARIYVPESAMSSAEARDTKLPILLYFHGGGFVLCSAASVLFHDYCCKVASRLKAILISVDYRLAPEHKLPAAFDDGFAALKWLQAQASKTPQTHQDPWLSSHADFSKCILMGHSAGGTIVAEVALRAASEGVEPVQIRGLILAIPFFGGIERTNSELEHGYSVEDVPLSFTDACWAASLPEGADRSHRYCCFMGAETQAAMERETMPPSLVVIGTRDPLRDRQVQFVEFVRKAGHRVTLLEFDRCVHDDLLYPEVTGEADLDQAHLTMQHFLFQCFQGIIENSLI